MKPIAESVNVKSEHLESIDIVELPEIVLEKVFSYLTYDEVAKCREATKSEKKSTFIDPFFNLKITQAKLTLESWKSLMTDKVSVRISNVKAYMNKNDNLTTTGWVNAGILVAKTNPKEAQNGSKYVIWTISDLKSDLKTVTVFLFSDAFESLWKTEIGTILAFLNPKIYGKSAGGGDGGGGGKKGDSEGSYSVNSSKNVIVLGVSDELGFCKSKKKDGSFCNKFLDKLSGDYCMHHIKSEYSKLTNKRSDLQFNSGGNFPGTSGAKSRNFNNYNNNRGFSRNEETEPERIVVSKPSAALLEKDRQILKCLTGDNKESVDEIKKVLCKDTTKVTAGRSVATSFDTSKRQQENDRKLLEAVKVTKTPQMTMVSTTDTVSTVVRQGRPLSSPSPVFLRPPLTCNGNASVIDLNAPITRRLRDAAKQKAIEYVRKHGPIGQLAKQALKRKSLMRDSPESPAKMLRECESSEEFQKRYEEMKNLKSINEHLVDDFQSQQRNKYFAKLEVKEKMEKQLMENSKLPCKAVQCLRCNYTSYSASESCKKDRHPLKVFDTFKRFFKCKSCSKRTVTLDEVIPTSRCSSCNSQSWEHTSVCKRFNNLGMTLLNKGFKQLDRDHAMLYKLYKSYLPRRESERLYHPFQRYVELLSSVDTRISLMRMTFNRFISANLCCFIPGKVIDEIQRVMDIVNTFNIPPNSQNHEILQEMRDITSMAMEHFDEKIVPTLRRQIFIGNRRSVLSQRTSGCNCSTVVNEVSMLKEQCRNLHVQVQKAFILNKRSDLKYKTITAKHKKLQQTLNKTNQNFIKQNNELVALRKLVAAKSNVVDTQAITVRAQSLPPRKRKKSPPDPVQNDDIDVGLRRSKRVKNTVSKFGQ